MGCGQPPNRALWQSAAARELFALMTSLRSLRLPAALSLLLLRGGPAELAPGPWAERSLPPGQRAALLLANLTQAEKLGFLHGGCKG